MFFLNLNVFIAIFVSASYLFGWFLGIPASMWFTPNEGTFFTFFLALALIVIWSKWGLVPRVHGPGRERLSQIGHSVLAVANVILLSGVGLSMLAALIDREEEYWFGLLLTSFIGPTAGVLAAISLVMIFSARVRLPSS